MLSKWKWVSVLAMSLTLAGCGGGGEATARGAIAVNTINGVGTIVTNYASQPEANSDALVQCARLVGTGMGCEVILELSGNGTCGSAARGNNNVWGVASGSSKEVADSRAMSDCVAKGGTSCVIPGWLETQCN